jgi:hypothetical protein
MQDSQVIRRPNALMANLLGARRGLCWRPTWTPEHVNYIWFLFLQVKENALQRLEEKHPFVHHFPWVCPDDKGWLHNDWRQPPWWQQAGCGCDEL